MRTGTFFEINISLNGKHILATDSSIRQYNEFQILELLELLKDKFSPDDGYEYTITCWHVSCPSLPENITKAIPKRSMKNDKE
jgi:UDP-galactopyranose mutase